MDNFEGGGGGLKQFCFIVVYTVHTAGAREI